MDLGIPSANTPSLSAPSPNIPTLPAPSADSLIGAGGDPVRAAEQQKQQDQLKLRIALNDAYAALEGQKSVQSFLAFTFEEAISNQIDRLTGTSTRLRPNELDRVNNIQQTLTNAIAQIKQTPPEDFLEPNQGRDVNTPATST